jgi:hypothetical protein
MEFPQFVLIGGVVAALMFLFLVYRTARSGEDRSKDGDPPREL